MLSIGSFETNQLVLSFLVAKVYPCVVWAPCSSKDTLDSSISLVFLEKSIQMDGRNSCWLRALRSEIEPVNTVHCAAADQGGLPGWQRPTQ